MNILQVRNGWFPDKVHISIAGNCGLEKKIGRFAFGNMIELSVRVLNVRFLSESRTVSSTKTASGG